MKNRFLERLFLNQVNNVFMFTPNSFFILFSILIISFENLSSEFLGETDFGIVPDYKSHVSFVR